MDLGFYSPGGRRGVYRGVRSVGAALGRLGLEMEYVSLSYSNPAVEDESAKVGNKFEMA